MKKIISYSLAVGIFSSVVITPFGSTLAASPKVESLISTAEKHAGVLKWEISYEQTKAIKKPDMKVFNATKSSYLQAQKEISKASGPEKKELEKRLEENVGVHYKRTMGYIDAITSGNKIFALTKQFEQQYAENPVADSTEKTYHELSAEIRKQAKLLYKVYGKSTRDAFLSKYKAPAELVLDNAKYTVTAKNDLRKLNTLVSQQANAIVINKQLNQLFDSLDQIVEDEIYYSLFDQYIAIIRKDPSFIAQEKELKEFFVKANDLWNNENVEGIFNLYSTEYPYYDTLKNDIQDTFAELNLRYELLNVETYSIINDYAYVEVTELLKVDSKSEEITSFYLMKKENNEWKYADFIDGY